MQSVLISNLKSERIIPRNADTTKPDALKQTCTNKWKIRRLNSIPTRRPILAAIKFNIVEANSDRHNHKDQPVDDCSVSIYENFQTPINGGLQWWGKILDYDTNCINFHSPFNNDADTTRRTLQSQHQHRPKQSEIEKIPRLALHWAIKIKRMLVVF